MPRVVLVHPQIPPNTGNIARTCAATETELHLVAPLGFEISDRTLKRAGLDYWPHVKLTYHSSASEFLQFAKEKGGRIIGLSVRGKENYLKCQYQEDDWLLFGSEIDGLPPFVLKECDLTSYITMKSNNVRSLNLSVSVSVVLFESIRQLS
ncbi:tRNA (cytidine(34)-2'-O)-methyltransferase [Cyanobacterium aponinum UTEX 3222]|uniref:Putative tRNA (cytidine(34)-2'-O)-methyltransferase n=3 Tax=Cyanobacterium aponinum TaxID=379064 RepID=K9Z7C3_CYAAP|nr:MULTISPECIES: tRNA (cytidine(34)-2'-O)-methyltransferase [Cyanobacterium]RMD70250.1 MAG: tRNA (cytidine(34)-2'-O)-methyltransferase [Cyanobacteria bacterium J149]WRL42969.1 tRNA (cytidine(34)-2'-O)-methyltransferase [Cyanobacterium aponinum UTEX 3222]AFZ55044.1 tRNA/rRNA methyltransferase (SpoU) [Cyanobacterium aponinum PCC 10605]MTF39190.1 tRNA (uridine(34)/cytosine(34)/5-carboxymethylaminomethyluridine(34)-2'-O)-methyltransferase TrmL [Cyanobacterium aponinum 0216]PHV63542.1 tRNA (cytidin